MPRNLHNYVLKITLLSFLIIPQSGLAQKDKDQNLSSIREYNIYDSVLSPAAVTYLNEDFSSAEGVTPPSGWTQNIIIGEQGVDLWHFDNPGNRIANQPMSEPLAIFDSENYSQNNQPEDVALESPEFSPPITATVVLEWYQYFNATALGAISVEVWNGAVWNSVYSSNTTTYNPELKSIDITTYTAGVTDAKIRFRWMGNYSKYWLIDNIIVYEPSNLPGPAIAVSPGNGGTDVDINSGLIWSAGAGADPTGYRLYFGTDGGGVNPPTNIEDNKDLVLNTSYTPAAPLLYGTTYYWMIVPYNTEGDAEENEIWSFTVIADPPVTTFPYLEEFEGTFPPLYYIRYSGPLSDSSILNSTIDGWQQDDWRNLVSPINKAARLNLNGESQNYWLATTLIDLGNENGYQLEFDLSLNTAGSSNPPETTGSDDRFAVIISTDTGKTWSSSNILKLWDNAGSTDIFNDISFQGEHITVDLTSYSGMIQIGFYGESDVLNANNDLMIDNIEINQIPVSGPIFSIDPPELNFGSVAIGADSTLPVAVTNEGNENLIINSITSTDGQFTVLPNTFPLTVTPGNVQTFNIIFSPLNIGNQSASLEFTHNADGSPESYSIQGIGINEGPILSVFPVSLNFGNVEVNTLNESTITVSNIGIANDLGISEAITGGSNFSVAPEFANIAAGDSQIFTVTFNPLAEGTYYDTLVFISNDPESPHTVMLTGYSGAATGLTFETDSVFQSENNSYTETLQLKGLDPLSDKINAIQFRMAVNKDYDDNIILTFQDIQKGSDISDANWILDYNLFRGTITGNGASVDSVYVLLYNLDQEAGLDPALEYNDIFTVKYRIARLPALQDTVKSSFLISDAQATTRNGYPVDITSSENSLTVMALNNIISIGDVNGDGYLDILDLIMVVDHIVGRDSLRGDFFTRADISPWITGATEPEPDGVVNVQDLSLIQNIILTGIYPNDDVNNRGNYKTLPKIAVKPDAKIKLFINREGISIYIDSKIDIRGAQLELNNINNNPEYLSITTDLGQGYYYKTGDLLRTLLYDRLALKFIGVGEHFMADIPLQITEPEKVEPNKVVLVDMNKNRIENTEVEIIYGDAPSLPLDYILFQNYPNPFNPATTIKFQVPEMSLVTIIIYNMLGQEIRTLFSEKVPRGSYQVDWDGMNETGKRMSSGTYIYRVIANDFVQSKKMILLK